MGCRFDSCWGHFLVTDEKAAEIEKSGHRIFANVPGGRVAVVDKAKGAIVATWSAGLLKKGNFPMALDEVHRRLFVGYRWPPRIVIFDTDSGKTVSELEGGGDADDIFYDPACNPDR